MVDDIPSPRSRLLTFLVLTLPWISCGSAPEDKPDPAVEQHYRENEQMRLERLAKSQNFQRILLDMDKAVSEFVNNTRRDDNEQAQRKLKAWTNWLATNVPRYRKELRLLLQDQESSRARQIAAAALGFDAGTDKNRVTLSALVMALETESVPEVKTNIYTGLGIYASPLTPTEKLFDLVLDTREPLSVRQSASWALLRIQIAGADPKGFARTWGLLLEGEPYKKDPMLAVNALQGLGLLRDPAQLMIIVPYLSDPPPYLQEAACVALGRLGNRKAAQYLLPLFGNAERNVSVKLFARKALQALAGDGVDHEYDWKSWAKEFYLEGTPETGFQPSKKKRPDQSLKEDKEPL